MSIGIARASIVKRDQPDFKVGDRERVAGSGEWDGTEGEIYQMSQDGFCVIGNGFITLISNVHTFNWLSTPTSPNRPRSRRRGIKTRLGWIAWRLIG